MTPAEKDLASELDTSCKRKVIFQAIKALKAGCFPNEYHVEEFFPDAKFLFERLKQAEETRRERLLAAAARDFPTDDEAWEQEIASRKRKELARQEALGNRSAVAV